MECICDESEGVSVKSNCSKSAQMHRAVHDDEPPISAKKKLKEMPMMRDSFFVLLSAATAMENG